MLQQKNLRYRIANLLAQRRAARRRAAGRLASGMTLIEIMVVLVILALIAGAISVNVFGQLKDAQIRTARLDLQSISNAIELYQVENNNTLPDNLQQLVPKFLDQSKLRKDPWQQDYHYVRSGEGFDVYSYGPDRAQGGGDDITVHGGGGEAPKR